MTIALPQENRFVTFTDWDGYEKFLEAVGSSPVRITYDRGALEIMSPSLEHEKLKNLLGTLLEFFLVWKGIEFEGGGQVTFRREDLDRGLEPDECYWIETVRQIEGRKSFQPDQGDPSPDLVIEVDITSRSIRRLPIYAALRVPEIWHYSHEFGLRVLLLQDDGEYLENPDSVALKGLGKADVDRFPRVGMETNLGRAAREFKEWLVSSER